MQKNLIVLFLLFAWSALAQAQTKSLLIKGRLVDASSIPLQGATISTGERKLSTTSGSDGEFKLQVETQEILFITFVGFKPISINLTNYKPNERKEIELGNILLQEDPNALQEVVIQSKRILLKQENDKIIYNVAQDPDRATSDLSDILKKAPYFSTDGQQLTFKGQARFKVLLNGKENATFNDNIQQVLRSLPANKILKIEISDQTPLKYEKMGYAGLINIITEQNFEGFLGSASLSYGTLSGLKLRGLGIVKHRKLAYQIGSNGTLGNYVRTGSSNTVVRNGSTLLNNNTVNSSRSNSFELNMNSSWEPDSLTLFILRVSHQPTFSKNIGSFEFSNQSDYYMNQNSSQTENVKITAELGIEQKGAKNKNISKTLNYQFSRNNIQLSSNNDYLNQVGTNWSNFYTKQQDITNQHIINLNISNTAKKLKYEAGLKGQFVSQHINAEPVNESSIMQPVQQPSRIQQESSDVEAYIRGSYSLKKISTSLKLSALNTQFKSSLQHFQSTFVNPTLNVSYRLSSASRLGLTYTLNTGSPETGILNNLFLGNNPNIREIGNALLKPERSNNVTLSFTHIKTGFFSVGLSYVSKRNQIENLSTMLSSENIISYINNDNTSWSLFANGNYEILKKIRYSFTLGSGILQYSNMISNLKNNPYFQIFNNFSYRIDDKYTLELVNSYNSNFSSLQGRNRLPNYFYIGGSTQWLDRKLRLSLGITNPFQRFQKTRSLVSIPTATQQLLSFKEGREISFGLSYRFGSLKSATVKTTNKGIDGIQKSNVAENRRLKN